LVRHREQLDENAIWWMISELRVLYDGLDKLESMIDEAKKAEGARACPPTP
jgi:hypothetical protein